MNLISSDDNTLKDINDDNNQVSHMTIKAKSFLFLLIAFVVFITYCAVSYFVEEEELNLEKYLKEQVEVMTLERRDVFSTMLSGLLKQSYSITKNDIFSLYAVENSIKKNEEGGVDFSYAEQLPNMINALTGFVQDSDFQAAYMIDQNGDTVLTSLDSRPLMAQQKLEALRLFDNGQVSYSVIRYEDTGLEFDMFVPVLPAGPQILSNNVVGVFIFTVKIDDQFRLMLQENPISGLKGKYYLFQQDFENKIQEVRLINSDAVLDTNLPISIFSGKLVEFDKRASLVSNGVVGDNSDTVYSFGVAINNTPFYLVWQISERVARENLDSFIINTYLIAVFFVFSFITAFGAFWWRSNSDHNKVVAEQYAEFAQKMEKQKQILDSINNNIKEFITLKDRHGKYIYVNPAFADATGSSVDDIIGRNDSIVLGHGGALKLERLDDLAISSQEPISAVDEIYLQGNKTHLQISKVPLMVENDINIVTVARDITDLVEEQERREKSVRQTVFALIRAVELRDPHLAGHSKRVSEFASLVARELKPDQAIERTVDIAAMLSQIGKLDIPTEILTAERRLTEDEMVIMRKHVENAESIISDIDFDVPVLQAISHMYERLDGSGYPRALKEDDVSIEGRILGVCDYFCARIEPRSYRQAILPKDALKFLEQNADKYDPKVVQALKRVLSSSIGERIIASVS